MTDDREAELLAACRADPEDLQARAVYADWLEERGDPRAAFLRVEHQLLTAPGRYAALRRTLDPAWIRALNGRHRITVTAVGDLKIHAIRAVRQATSWGLREAKELVESVSPATPRVLLEALEPEEARAVVAECAEYLTLVVEPALPAAGRLPALETRAYRVLLVAVSDHAAALELLHARGWPMHGAERLVEELAHGPAELAVHGNATTALEIAVRFGAVGTVRVEYA